MALWDKLKDELNRAGEVAQDALDEGKARLEEFRARQRADKSAQALGYAVFRARQEGKEIDAEVYARLSSELAAAEADARRYQEMQTNRSGKGGARSATADPQPPV